MTKAPNKENVIPDGYIVDYIDGKFRPDTPEEYVRQNIEKKLVLTHQYSKDKIQIEHQISAFSKKPRIDIAIFKTDKNFSQQNIEIIIECKKENVSPKDKKDGVGQMLSYMSACPNCSWGMWTNGKSKFVYKKEIKKGKNEFIDYNDIPSNDGSIDDIDKPKRKNLKNAVEDNLLLVFKTCHNHIYRNDGLGKPEAFFQLLKVIFCKIEDERNFPNELEFYSTSNERNNSDGQLTVQKRIHRIFEKVKRKYNKIFSGNDEINLKPRSLAWTVSELQSYSLLTTNIDIKGKAYEEIVGSNLRGDKGQFFTPRNVTKMSVEIISPKENEKILDPACGTGGFLVSALNDLIETYKSKTEKNSNQKVINMTERERNLFNDKINEFSNNNFFGLDIDPELVKATKMNMVMNNDGSGNILQCDTLLHPHEWETEFKRLFLQGLKSDQNLTKNKDLELFDIVLSNPPFGSKIPVSDPEILSQYDLGYIWKFENEKWNKTEKLQTSVPPEQLFIERCFHFLKPKGKAAIVLPDGILNSPGLEFIRYWIMTKFYIIGSLDLHEDTFQPKNGTQTSVLILLKKEEKNQDKLDQSNKIFMAKLDNIGQDKRANPVFKKDDYGDEILITVKENGSYVKKKIINDDTLEIPTSFKNWIKKEKIKW
jgi:type I restriction enzyme M protein